MLFWNSFNVFRGNSETSEHGSILALSYRASRALDEENGGPGEELMLESDMQRAGSSSDEIVSHFDLATSLADPIDSFYFKREAALTLSPRQRNQLPVAPENPNAIELKLLDPYRNHLWGMPQTSSKDGTSAIPYILAGSAGK
jgi:hypothetical protein